MITKTMGAVATLILVGGSAIADDNSWTGFYEGVNEGISLSSSKVSGAFDPGVAADLITSVNNAATQTLHMNGFTGGLTAGYNFQQGNWVFGIEGDFNSFDTHDSKSVTGLYSGTSTNFTLNQTVDTDWLATLRPRVGWTTGRLLVYGTGGLSLTELKYKDNFSDTLSPTPGSESSSKGITKLGWILGVGGEYTLAQNWSVKGEYLYTDFGSLSSIGSYGGAFPFDHSADLGSNIIRAGVNYKF